MSADNVKVDGEAVNGEDFNLQSALSGDTPDAADGGLDALSGALGGDETSIDSADLGGGGDNPLDGIFSEASDNATQQDGPPAAAGVGAAGLDIAADEVETEEVDEAQVDEIAMG